MEDRSMEEKRMETLSRKVKELSGENSLLRKIVAGTIAVAVATTTLSGIFAFNLTRYYVVDSYGGVRALMATREPQLTKSALFSFAENAIESIFGVSYEDVDEKIRRSEYLFYPESYKDFVRELKRSGFVEVLKKLHRDVNVVPTNSVYEIKVVRPGLYDVYRSFAVRTMGDDGTNLEEVVFKVRIAKAKRTPERYSGLVVISVKEMSVKEYENNRKKP